MNSLYGVRHDFLMSYAKIVKKRLAISLAQAHNLLSRSSGYRDLYHLQSSAVDPDSNCNLFMTMDRWIDRLRTEIGADFDSLFPTDELSVWFRRIYAPHSGINN